MTKPKSRIEKKNLRNSAHKQNRDRAYFQRTPKHALQEEYLNSTFSNQRSLKGDFALNWAKR